MQLILFSWAIHAYEHTNVSLGRIFTWKCVASSVIFLVARFYRCVDCHRVNSFGKSKWQFKWIYRHLKSFCASFRLDSAKRQIIFIDFVDRIEICYSLCCLFSVSWMSCRLCLSIGNRCVFATLKMATNYFVQTAWSVSVWVWRRGMRASWRFDFSIFSVPNRHLADFNSICAVVFMFLP